MSETAARLLAAACGMAAIVLLAWFAVRHEPPTARPATAPAAVAPSAGAAEQAAHASSAVPRPAQALDRQRVHGLADTIRALLAATVRQESAKDATCWTTVRMMDAHFAGKPIADEVAALKIEACKSLVCLLWRAASSEAQNGDVLVADDIDPNMPAPLRQAVARLEASPATLLDGSAQAVKNRDYQRVTENKRYLIAVAQEALEGSGLFASHEVDLLPLDQGAAERLAAFATIATTEFLARCGQAAQRHGHAEIEADDMKESFAETSKDLGLDTVAARRGVPMPEADPAEMLAFTRQAIADKVTALRAWNAAIWTPDVKDPQEHQRELLNRFCRAEFTRDGFRELCHKLEVYAEYLAWGVTPMTRNATVINRFSPEMRDGTVFRRARKQYDELDWGLNVINDLFPRSIATNGDVTVRLMNGPAEPTVISEQPRIVLLDYELDAVRDTTIHWSIMQQAWSGPEARPADPFVLELLADRLSELTLLILRTCDGAAADKGLSSVDAVLCDHVLDHLTFAVPPRPDQGWSAAELAQKPSVLARIPAMPFRDASAEAGFPAEAALRRSGMDEIGNGQEAMSLVKLMGAGVAVGDIDGDGLPDLFLVGEGGNRLLRNLGGHRFRDVTAELGITDTRLDDAHQALFVDYDNDGRLDLFIVHSHSPSRLFHQLPNGHFEDATASCGLATGPGAHDAVWFDFDNDGLLDCYVGYYGLGHPTLDGRNGPGNHLYRNLGNGRFADVTERSGAGTTGWTLATAALDYDHDGWPDLFVANDYGRSELLHNNRDGTFTECGRPAGVDDRGAAMNASIIDCGDDGWMGLYITQIDMFSKSIGFVFPQGSSVLTINERILRSTFSIAGNKLYKNQRDGTFASIEHQVFEPGDRGWAWCANFFDYDNSGIDDCYLTNGWIDGTPAARQRHQFFVGAHGRYYQWDKGGDQGYAGNGRGCVAADLGGHGHIDLVVNDFGDRPRLLVNASADGNHWLEVRLRGVRCNRLGVGAEVAVVHEDGTRQWRQVSCGSNYLSQEDTTLHFGLGAAERADGIEVRWPGNHLQRVHGPIQADEVVEVVEGLDAWSTVRAHAR